MKRYNVRELKGAILESSATRRNILMLLESAEPSEPYVIGKWGGNTITLPDGIQLKTKHGVRCKDCPVKVFNKDGQYSAYETSNGVDRQIELTYIINESIEAVSTLVVYD